MPNFAPGMHPRNSLSLPSLLLALGLLCASVELFAQTGNRDQYLTFRDSLNIFRDGDRLFIRHVVAPGQTLFSLARFYGLELEEFLYYNPAFKDRLPAIMDTVHIPIPKKAILPYRYPDYARWKVAPLFYTAQKGETLYQIARRTFGVPVDSLLHHNPLQSEQLQPGDVLFIGWLSTKGIPDSIRQFTGHPLWGRSHRLRSQYMQQRKLSTEHQQQGYGNLILSESTDQELVILHNEAPLNSVVALKNPLNNRIVFARIIGQIPPGTYPPGTVVVTSQTVARMLAVKDDRYFIRIKYLTP
jgi:LysM repeat protein